MTAIPPAPWWKWPFKLVATVPVVWLLAENTRREGGVLGEVAALGAVGAVVVAAVFLLLVVLYCRDLQRLLESVPERHRAASPRSVWWMMVLPLNFVEDFFIVAHVTRSLERAGHGQRAARLPGFGWCAAQLVSLWPGVVGAIASVVAVPLWAAHWWSVRAAILALAPRAVPSAMPAPDPRFR